MHIKYCKTEGQTVLSFGRQFAYTAPIVPLDKKEREREKAESFSLCFFLFSEGIKKARHFVAHTHTHTHTHRMSFSL